jgi:hypothetical protein
MIPNNCYSKNHWLFSLFIFLSSPKSYGWLLTSKQVQRILRDKAKGIGPSGIKKVEGNCGQSTYRSNLHLHTAKEDVTEFLFAIAFSSTLTALSPFYGTLIQSPQFHTMNFAFKISKKRTHTWRIYTNLIDGH